MFVLKAIIGIFLLMCIILATVLVIVLFDTIVKKIVAVTKKYPVLEKIRTFIVNAFLVLVVIFIVYVLMSFCYQIGDKII